MKLLFPFDESPSLWLYRAHTQGVAALRKDFLAAGFDLTPEQWAIMTRIRGAEGHNINRIINILEKRGYTERRPDEGDKRAYRLFLTEAGMDTLKKSTPIVLRHFEKRFRGISAGDLSALRRILEHIVKNIEKIDEPQKSESRAVKKIKMLKGFSKRILE